MILWTLSDNNVRYIYLLHIHLITYPRSYTNKFDIICKEK